MTISGETATDTVKQSKFVGRVRLTPEHGPVGTDVLAEGFGLPANSEFTLVWESYDAEWKIEQRDGVDWNQFRGLRFSDRQENLIQVSTDKNGDFKAQFEIPEDFGGMHDVYLMAKDRKLNKAGFRIDLSAKMSPSEGPVGTPISISLYGMNPAHPIEGWYQIYYDNKMTGFVTAVQSKGTATFNIPATGDVGTHLIALEDASFGVPYLGLECSPYAYLKTFQLPFELTPGEPVLPPPIQEQLQLEQPAAVPEGEGACLWTDDFEIPCGAAFTVFGRGLPANQTLQIRWLDIVGDRVSEMNDGRFGTGFQEMPVLMGEVTCDAQGCFKLRVVPESVQGGAHVIEAWDGKATLAQTYLRMTKRGYPLRPKAGPIGTPITVEVDGVSWTEHENLIAINYDNSLVGYACGNDLMGKILAKIHATGTPGWHFIDVYPAFRTRRFSVGIDEEIMEVPYLYQKSIVTWKDHPHGFHFCYAFKVEAHSTKENS